MTTSGSGIDEAPVAASILRQAGVQRIPSPKLTLFVRRDFLSAELCSALIAQAFEHVHYPILPKVTRLKSETARRDILEIRHSSLYAPREFDISPYFALVKPTIENGFDYRRMAWAHLPHTCEPEELAEESSPSIAPAH